MRAIEREGEATQRSIDLLQERISYLTREGATAQELAQADQDRARLIDLITRRQQQLHMQAVAARQAIEDLRRVQAGLNLTSEEGRRDYEAINREIERLTQLAGDARNPVGQLSLEWWRLQRLRIDLERGANAVSITTIRTLDELRDRFDRGRISLEDYVRELFRLEQQSGLTADALDRLNREQARALEELWTRQIEEELEKAEKRIAQFEEDLNKHL